MALEQAELRPRPSLWYEPPNRSRADMIRDVFETRCELFFAFNGTAANQLALALLCQSYHSIVCHELAHVETNERGAPEFFSNGTKVLTVGGAEGKVAPEAIERIVLRRTIFIIPNRASSASLRPRRWEPFIRRTN